MDIKALQSKVSEVKSLFILAQRILPFMEELFEFISSTTPLLDNINNTIKDNLKKMPNASKQLTKVTQATEMASTEIMDTVDRINEKLYQVINELEEFKEVRQATEVNSINLLRIIADGIQSGKDLTPILDEINQFIERNDSIISTEHLSAISGIIDEVNNISMDANSIINSLQVQDITAQQLAAVNHLLENIQEKLSRIMSNLNPVEEVILDTKFDESIKISKLHRNIAFDPDAVDSITAENRQEDIDKMLANPDVLLNENINEIEVEQSNTINHFQSDAESTFENNSLPNTTTELENTEEEFSQDDIDAMFN